MREKALRADPTGDIGLLRRSGQWFFGANGRAGRIAEMDVASGLERAVFVCPCNHQLSTNNRTTVRLQKPKTRAHREGYEWPTAAIATAAMGKCASPKEEKVAIVSKKAIQQKYIHILYIYIYIEGYRAPRNRVIVNNGFLCVCMSVRLSLVECSSTPSGTLLGRAARSGQRLRA